MCSCFSARGALLYHDGYRYHIPDQQADLMQCSAFGRISCPNLCSLLCLCDTCDLCVRVGLKIPHHGSQW